MFHHISRRVATFAATLALASAITGASGAAALAQDATPEATPVAISGADCMAPSSSATPGALPVSGEGAATPVTNEPELPAGTPVDSDVVITQATTTIKNLYACYNAGNGEAVVALFTPSGLNAAYGAGSPDTVAEQVTVLASVAPASNLDVNSVVSYEDGRIGVDYQVAVGSRLLHFVDVLVEDGGVWKIDERREQKPETELDSTTAGIKTSVEEGALVIEVSPNPVANQPAVKFQLVNQGSESHFLLIFQTPEGFDGSTLIEADLSNLPEGVTLVGEDTVDPGEFADTLFQGLEEGTYVIVGSVVNTSGEPTGVTGWTEFTIDPPFDPTA